MSRRKTLAVIGGGVILAATAGLGYVATRQPQTARLPWASAGQGEDARRRALSYALLAPNPHNIQPWLVDLSEPDVVTLYVDLNKLLPHTDPYNRQITIGLGCFLELMRMAASHDGQRVTITPFPEGFDDRALDARPIARAVFAADPSVAPDPLFAYALDRRSNKEPYDTARPLPADTLAQLDTAVSTRFGGTIDAQEVAEWRAFTREALRIEIVTPPKYKESVDLFRIGRNEVDANPDGIDFTGPMFEVMAATGLFTRESAFDTSSPAYQAGMDAVFANADTAMGHVWLVSQGNSRPEQLATGADWLRVNLAATSAGVAFHPLSQALQEYPEMAELFRQVHEKLAPDGGTVQMLARIGYGPVVNNSPRWPLGAKIVNA
ncbi:MAG: twin-arginine translocation pathway signal protein [Rhodobacter sp.]|nr:twin-arginine translocation pathway signal protein [Rhodobacter sp.]MCA3455940.1 twin-arginine translocation pathway signal protein [Rhodobacter sp.]MCA3462466.1 twin-arginine translocation pathway signal protein [Rhodobacter sp.]MCA3464898.1 twin-arginine translocation pathway signal protein [Rhodobacter sp.]MCA3467188.1 twin-arginine translocation pathway signal protein [Rhodobacter sp.]